ncbi:UPF0764 protein C16orf89 homolog [Antedon mediterranea]|uniref:UPF0764 protein C16orf89 homolog n=1 Tax=Antedon mediterranea TaxID=105859 RepID=UPI003AF815A7
MGYLTVTFTILLLIHSSSSDLNQDCVQNEKLLETILTSLQNSLVFLGKEYDSLNLDVISGLRMTQAEIKAAFVRTPYLPTESGKGSLQARLAAMSTFIDEIVTLAKPYVYRTLPVYYNNFSELLKKEFWAVSSWNKDHVLLNTPFSFGNNQVEKITEAASDRCLTELLGTGPSKKKCTIASECLAIMEADGYKGYEVTHQLLYFILIDRLRCFSYDRIRHQRNDYVIKGLCSNIFQQASDLSKTEFNGRIDHDLFMEQIAFCGGLLGYKEFLRSDWLNYILSWQLDSGCFSVINSKLSENSGYRRKRMDVKLADGGYGCFGHCTAVAVISLGGYLRETVATMKTCIEWN